MFALERQKKILEILSADGAVSVNRLSLELGVTEETVRRDLEKLEKQEFLKRTHGGAVAVDENTNEMSLEKRKSTNVEAKQRIAKLAATQVNEGDTIFLDASTTTFFMARELKSMHNITIITNSLRVVVELDGCESVKVISVGGVLSHNQSFVGSHAEQDIAENYVASKMFFSSKGVTLESGILESNEQESGIKKKMLKNSRHKYYLCDSSKVGSVGFVKLAKLDEINCLITDKAPESELLEKLEELEVGVLTI